MAKQLYAAVCLMVVAGLSSCTNAKNALEWDGFYAGTVPGADSGIQVEITLTKDSAYTVSYRYMDKSDDVFTRAGTFKWKDNNTVELDTNEIPPYYVVGKDTLTQLDMAGKKINGVNANDYILQKK